MKKYLVTGASGFIGAAIVRRLLKAGHFVRGIDNHFRGGEKWEDTISKHMEFVEADIRDSTAVVQAAKGMDAIVHLAYINGTEFFYKMPELVLDVAVRGMISVLDACKQNNVSELILASSSEVYQTPATIPTDESVPLTVPDVLNPRYSYGGGKIISELLTLHTAVHYVKRAIIFRPHNVYGPNMGNEHVIPQFILRALEQSQKFPSGAVPFSLQGNGEQTRAFIYIEDFVEGLMRVIENGEHLNIYHIGTEEEVKMLDVANHIFRLLNREPCYTFTSQLQGSTLRRCPSIAKLRKLGFNPVVDLGSGLKQTLQWYSTSQQPLHKEYDYA